MRSIRPSCARVAFVFVLVLLAGAGSVADAAAFTAGNLVVYRVGTGAALTANGTAIVLDEYAPTGGAVVQSISLPTTTVGAQRRIVASGTATTEGQMTRSTDGQFLVLPGYDAALGTASLTSSTSASVNRVIARVDANGNVDTSTAFGATVRVGTVGSGLPTTTGQTMTNLPGFSTTNAPNQFFFADLSAGVAGVDTLYVADESAGQVQKFSLVAGTWTANGTIAAASVRGLTGRVSGTTVTLFGTYSAGSKLFTLADSSGYNATITGTVTDLATAAANTAFCGVALAPQSAITFPTVSSITRVSASPTNAASVSFTITFSESVSGVDTGDFALTTTGVAGASITGVSPLGPAVSYTVTVNTGSGDGTIRLDVTDNDSIVNGGSAPLGGEGAGNGNFTTGQVYTIDKTVPTVASIV